MKISYNPKSSQTAITTETAANDDIIFDLYTSKLWAKGVRIGADWADISSKPSSLKNPYAIKFRDINGNEVSYDGSSAKDLTTGTYIAKLPYGFSSFAPKPTWGNTTGTSIASWNDSNGGSIDFRKDNPSSGKLSIKVDGRVYVNEGVNPVLSAEFNNDFWGMRTPDGDNDWIRTPNSGLIPYVQGNAGSGHSSLGASGWYFSTAYIDKVYGSLKGNADTATTATKATKADNATNAKNADKLDGWHKDNIQWTGYISSNTANLQSYWAKMYDVTITNKQYDNTTITFLVSDGYDGNFSIFYLRFRQNGANGSGAYNLTVTLQELVGNLKNKIVAYYNNKTGNVQLWGNAGSQYGVLNYTILKKAWRVSTDFATLGTLTAGYFSTVQTQPTTDYTKVTMSRIGQVRYAESSSSSTQATKLQTARNLWGNSFDGTKDINGSIVFPGITDTAISNKISWNGSTDGADIYYQTTAKDQGNLVLNVRDDTNAYIQLALNGTFKSHFDVANSYWTGRSALADKWTTARTFTIGNTAKNVDGSGNVSWSLSEIGVRDTWRTVQVNSTSIGNNTLNLCGSTYIGLTNVNGKVTFSLVGSGTTANQAILSNGTANGWTLKTLNIDNWNTAYNFVSTITGTDTDNVINKWDEIVNFLAGITEDNKLNTLLNSKLSIQQLSAKDILTTKTNNALFWVNTIGTAGSITTGPFTDHPYALLSVTNFSQNDTNGKFFYRSRLAFSSAGDIKVASCHHQNEYKQDDAWYNVLTSKNSGISGSTIKLNGTSITVYSSSAADNRYYTKAKSDAKYITNITTTVNKLTFTKNGANINKDITVNQVLSKGNLTNIADEDNTTKADSGLFIYNSYSQVIGTNSYSSVLSIRTGGTIQIAGDWGDEQTRNLYWRSQSDRAVASYPWKPWRTILDTGNSYVRDGKGVINGTTITQVDNATKLQTARKLWGQSFDGTADVKGALTGTGTITPGSAGASDIGSNSLDYRYGYFQWLGSKTGTSLRLAANNSDNQIVLHTNGYVGIGTNSPAHKLQVMGDVYATSTVTSAGFKHSAVTKNANQYVLTADGGYTFLNQASNELAHEFSKNITVTSEWTDIEDFYGGNQSFLTQPGTYIVQVYYTTNSANSMYEGYFSGIMSWYTGKTDSNNADEIVLHRVGHAYANTIYLRTRESLSSEENPYTKLQISANSDLKQHTYKFKFKRIC